MTVEKARPPQEKDNIVRAQPSGFTLRAADDAESPPVMEGHFAVFNQWTEIDSIWEGHFLERILPGAFAKTFDEKRERIRVLLEHGHDPQVGNKPLGVPEELEEDDEGARYGVPLFDVDYVRQLLPALESKQYGSSFRFRVMREEIEEEPKTSKANPKQLPERTIKEVELYEFGPVTFPAYDNATAGLRSLTDEMMLRRFAGDPEHLEQLLHRLLNVAPPKDAGKPATSEGRRAVSVDAFLERRMADAH